MLSEQPMLLENQRDSHFMIHKLEEKGIKSQNNFQQKYEKH